MWLRELIEGVITVFGHGKGGGTKGHTVRKYRCTTGPRKGRVVAKAATCNAPKNMKASNTLKRTRRAKENHRHQAFKNCENITYNTKTKKIKRGPQIN